MSDETVNQLLRRKDLGLNWTRRGIQIYLEHDEKRGPTRRSIIERWVDDDHPENILYTSGVHSGQIARDLFKKVQSQRGAFEQLSADGRLPIQQAFDSREKWVDVNPIFAPYVDYLRSVVCQTLFETAQKATTRTIGPTIKGPIPQV